MTASRTRVAPGALASLAVQQVQLDPVRVDRFCALLAAHPRRRVERADLWCLFANAFPTRPIPPAERHWLLAALYAAAERGVVTLPTPNGRRWDRSTAPAVPDSVDRIAGPAPPPDASWRRYPWHPSLAWVGELSRLDGADMAWLKRLSEALRLDTLGETVPLKYRSLQLAGDEKRLSDALRSPLFGDGRLTLDILRCLPEVTPMAWERVGDCGRVLVVENTGAFAVARRVLQSRGESSGVVYDVVAFGGGKAAVGSIAWLATIEPRPTTIHYVGDLDRHGLDIALGVRATAARSGLPPVEPAPGLHQAMFAAAAELGHADGWPATKRRRPARTDAELAAFLPEDLRTRAEDLLSRGHRIPEEVLTPAALRGALHIASSDASREA